MVMMTVIIIMSTNDITAVIRLSNEAEWLPKCLESIIDIFDEILLCTQGAQKDNTIEICKLAFKLEQKFNKFCGYQDPYGCGIGGFKKIEFEKGSQIKYHFLSQKFLNIMICI